MASLTSELTVRVRLDNEQLHSLLSRIEALERRLPESPVERWMRAYDREPYSIFGHRDWIWTHPRYTEFSRELLPWPLYRMLPEQGERKAHASYSTREAAVEALAAALLRLGEEAGS